MRCSSPFRLLHSSASLIFEAKIVYCILLYRLFNVSFCNNEKTLIKTNIKQFQGLRKTDYLLQNEYAHLFSNFKEPSFDQILELSSIVCCLY